MSLEEPSEKTLSVTKQQSKASVVTNKKVVFVMSTRHGKLLAQARSKNKLTQAQLAQKINVRVSIIQEAEAGKGELPKALCLKINQVLKENIF